MQVNSIQQNRPNFQARAIIVGDPAKCMTNGLRVILQEAADKAPKKDTVTLLTHRLIDYIPPEKFKNQSPDSIVGFSLQYFKHGSMDPCSETMKVLLDIPKKAEELREFFNNFIQNAIVH